MSAHSQPQSTPDHLGDGLKVGAQDTAERVGFCWVLPSEGGDGDVGAIWSEWSAVLHPLYIREGVALEGAAQGDIVSAVDDNVHLW